jgi:hypothetical protein
MSERELATLVNLMMESILAGGLLLADMPDAQIVIRPIFTWPDGQPALWVIVNCPN